MAQTSPKPIVPEVLEDLSRMPRDLLALKAFAHLMDEAVRIPGTRKRIGLDAAIGVVPGVGDVIGALMSGWIVVGALRHRVPLRKIGRMFWNIGVDLVIGSVPLVGDVFDFFWEENKSNYELLMRHRDRVRPPRSVVSMAFAAVAVVSILIVLSLALLFAVAMLVTRMMQGSV